MSERSRTLVNLLFPALLCVFLGLYVAGIAAGAEAETAMLRAGLASVVLAFVGQFAAAVLESVPTTVPVEEGDSSSSTADKE